MEPRTTNIISEPFRPASHLGTFPPGVQQPQQQKRFDHLSDYIDPKLQERIEECKRQNSTLPMTKEIMKCKILERRAQQGLADINVTFDEQHNFPLTAEEEEKRQRRRDQNKKAAAKCRDRRKRRDKILTQEVGQEIKRNFLLREHVKRLKAEKDDLFSQLIYHERTCPLLVHSGQMTAYNTITKSSPKNDDDCYYKNNSNCFCETIPTSGESASGEKPYVILQTPIDANLTKADDNSYVSSMAFNGGVGTSVDCVSFPFPSPSYSPSPFVSSPALDYPPSSFPFAPSSTLSLSPPNLFPSPPTPNVFHLLPPLLPPPPHPPSHSIPLSSNHFFSSSALSIPTRLPSTLPSTLPVHLSPLSPQAPSFSPSSPFPPSSPFSFSSSFSCSPSSPSFSSTSSLASDCAPGSIPGPGYPNNQTSYSRTDGDFLDTANFVLNIDLYNPNPNHYSVLTNNPGRTHLHAPLTGSQIEDALLQTDTQHIQRSDSGDNCENLLQFPMQLPQETYEHSLIDRSGQHISNQMELDLQMYL